MGNRSAPVPNVDSAANAQEAPTSIEPKSAPLTKQQQDEAAKLAETRKRFDNERYHQKQQSQPNLSDATNFGLGSPQGGARQGENAAIVGLSLTNQMPPDGEQFSAILPGGIFDDEIPLQIPQQSSKNQKQLRHFDDDEEALMQEIL